CACSTSARSGCRARAAGSAASSAAGPSGRRRSCGWPRARRSSSSRESRRMPTRIYKPTSPGRRQMSVSTFDELADKRPERTLVEGRRSSSGGRNSYGRVTAWHRGGGHKKLFRKIDFRRDKLGVPAKVAAIEYDPNRSARIALLHYKD